jgi:hypothetical protein
MASPRVSDLFRPTENHSYFESVVGWWELRRIAFNLLVGTTGVASLVVSLLLLDYIPESGGGGDFSPALSVIGFGIFANLFYTSGWIVEGIILAIRRHGSPSIGPRLFRLGLCFSLILTLLPSLALGVEVLYKLLRHS